MTLTYLLYKSQSWFSMIRSLSVLTSMTSTGEALKNQTRCLIQYFPTFKPRNQQVTLYFLLDGDLYGQHIILIKPTQTTRRPFSPLKWLQQCNDVSRLFTVKNVNKLFSNNLTQTLHGTGVIYQHVAIKSSI